MKNGSVPVVPLYSYPQYNNGSFVQIPVSPNKFFFLSFFLFKFGKYNFCFFFIQYFYWLSSRQIVWKYRVIVIENFFSNNNLLIFSKSIWFNNKINIGWILLNVTFHWYHARMTFSRVVNQPWHPQTKAGDSHTLAMHTTMCLPLKAISIYTSMTCARLSTAASLFLSVCSPDLSSSAITIKELKKKKKKN